MSARKDPPWPRSMATSRCTGAPSNDPCADNEPLGADGKPRTFNTADSAPVGESRTERVEVNRASPPSAVTGPSIVPDASSVPATAGDNDLRSRTLSPQRAWRIEGVGFREAG